MVFMVKLSGQNCSFDTLAHETSCAMAEMLPLETFTKSRDETLVRHVTKPTQQYGVVYACDVKTCTLRVGDFSTNHGIRHYVKTLKHSTLSSCRWMQSVQQWFCTFRLGHFVISDVVSRWSDRSLSLETVLRQGNQGLGRCRWIPKSVSVLATTAVCLGLIWDARCLSWNPRSWSCDPWSQS